MEQETAHEIFKKKVGGKVLHVSQNNGRTLCAFGANWRRANGERGGLVVSIDEGLKWFPRMREQQWLNVTGS